MVKLDTDKQGFELVFDKPYKASAMKYLFSTVEADVREIHEFVLKEGNNISRTSIIFLLQKMEKRGWLTSYERSGKGGMHNVYSSVMNAEEFWRHICDVVSRSLIAESGIADLYHSLHGSANE